MNRKELYIILLCVVIVTPAIAQNNISITNTGSPPDSSAILDVQSTTQGLLVPRMTTGQREAIPSPATGLIVYDLDANSFWCYAGSSWIEVMAGFTSLLQDTDGDTKVQVEESSDDDIIRFDVEGTERWAMTESRLEPRNSGRSVFIGESAGASDDLNDRGNIAIGSAALKNNDDRVSLVAVGDSALYQNGFGNMASYQGIKNTAVGSKSLYANLTGYANTAIGSSAMYSNIDGANNTASGANAMFSNIGGDNNTATGNEALFKSATGSGNTAIGAGAMRQTTTGYLNTAVGSSAMWNNTTGFSNSALGRQALHANTTGTYNSAVGEGALLLNSEGTRNTAMGFWSMKNNTVGQHNAAIGSHTLYYNTTGSRNTAIGMQAVHSNTTGASNTAIGHKALFLNTVHSNLVAIGDSALYNNGTDASSPVHSIKNTAVGSKSLYANTTGYGNTATGFQALYSNISGGQNTAIGSEALRDNSSGNWNTAMGSNALQENTTAWSNTAVGFNAAASTTFGGTNVAIGSWSLHSNVNGSYNVGVGSSANRYNVGGSWNTIIGYAAGYGSIEHNKTGNVFIGYKAGYSDTTDNKLYVENSSSSLPLIYGDFTNGSELVGINGDLGVGTQAPDHRFHVKEDGVDSVQTIVALLESSVSARPLLLFSENATNTLGSGMSIEYNGATGFGGDNEMYINKVGGLPMVTFESNGKMGIATTAPTDQLHVSAPADAAALRVQVGGMTKLRVHQNGGISVGYNPGLPGPSYALQLQNNTDILIGSGRAYSWVTYSDGRMKSQQEPLKYGMKEILQLQPKSYLHHSSLRGEDAESASSKIASKKDIGLIAQEVAHIIPEIVYAPAEGSDDLWSVDYMRLVPVLIRALQEQQESIDSLQLKYDELLMKCHSSISRSN